MEKLSADQKEAGSFRDPSGFLFYRNGALFRQVNLSYKEDYDCLIRSGLYQKLAERGLLIPHEETEEKGLQGPVYKVMRPEQIAFISYPFEWGFSQLKDAALLTLEVQKTALEHKMSLKDANAFNIQFRTGRPVLIDTLSFKTYEEGRPWVAYRQFCQHFLAPLALMSYRDIRLNQLGRVYLDGIPLDLASRLLPWRSRLDFGLLIHLHLHARSQQRFADRPIKEETGKFSRLAFLGLIESLEKAVRRLNWKPGRTEWGDYYQATNYSEPAFEHKKDLVADFLSQAKPASVWDLGANTGFFSRISGERGIPTVAWDIDPLAVEKNYLECRGRAEKNVLPLLLDLGNPTPALGWGHEERRSFAQRGPADLVLALALVHHLAISNHLPLERIAGFFARLSRFLVIEFVPKSDSQVKRLFLSRDDIFPHYDRASFEAAFSRYFAIEKAAPVRQSERILYLMRTLQTPLL
ncbi:MAG: SAM-dependent methyltransferase [Candidatus Omnitrophica bacterium]|nr:SAM-dependent methyltransferase [Candidatus Omnitrophota bacterium]